MESVRILPFNRTTVGLKHPYPPGCVGPEPAFNRTTVGLKPSNGNRIRRMIKPF